jgi:glycosyltransferase involved in cell wall biosynthesis
MLRVVSVIGAYVLPELVKRPIRQLRGIWGVYRRLFGRDFVAPLRLLPEASLYYLHAPYEYFAVSRKCRQYGVPFIYDAHDFYTGIGEMVKRSLLDRLFLDSYFRFLERCCIRKAAAVVTVSDGVAALMHDAFGCRPVVIRNCHDARLDTPPEQDLRQVLDVPDDAFLILVVGQSKNGQALAQAIEALADLPRNVHLALIGRGYSERLGRDLPPRLWGRVHAVDPVMPREVVPFIRRADASLILYYARSENYLNCLPNGFFQSVSAGLPLLYPDLPEISRLARQFDLGIAIDPLKPESIRDGILTLLGDRQRLAQFRENAQAAAKELSWEKEEVVLRSLVEQVLASASQRRA